MASEPPPRPPPHGQNPRPPGGGLPEGNYDIFIIPPHSAGSGFLYLPSLQVRRNSFLAGVACTLLAVGVYTLIVPALREFLATVVAGGGVGVLLLVVGVGVAGWAWGKTQGENNGGPGFGFGGGSANGAGQRQQQSSGAKTGRQANGHAPPPKPEPKQSAASGWEKAREETRKREEARQREEEAKKRREEAKKTKEEAERAAKAKAEKDKWEQARAREKEHREREARERIAREREAREKEKAKTSSPNKPNTSHYRKPTARSYDGTEEEYSYRPYDAPKNKPGHKSPYASSGSDGMSDASYAGSHETARTTPPPSHRGPYKTDDPDKIHIKAVYLFSDSFPLKPLASLVANTGSVTDGLILRLKTEGLFIDDDVRGVPQREWDVKAWTLKLVEDGLVKKNDGTALHVLRATARDAESKKYCFVLDEREAWKVAVGLGRLRKGGQVRALGMNGMKDGEVRALLSSLGWM